MRLAMMTPDTFALRKIVEDWVDRVSADTIIKTKYSDFPISGVYLNDQSMAYLLDLCEIVRRHTVDGLAADLSEAGLIDGNDVKAAAECANAYFPAD